MMIEFNNVNNGTNRHHKPLDMMQWETYTTTEVMFLPKMSGPNLTQKAIRKSRKENILYETGLDSKNVNVNKHKKGKLRQ